MEWKMAMGKLRENSRLGLDVGSRSTKFALKDGRKEILGAIDTTDFIFGDLMGAIPPDVKVVSTGYGRNKVPFGRTIPEIRAHTVGALKSLNLESFTLLDIGGQDFKIIRIENRSIRDFQMNDKCAAGTGRFLEKMADMLNMGVEELGAHRGDRKILESTCSVFTETEIISLMMEGANREELAGGVIYSVYERIRPYLRMFPADILVFTGGVANCKGLVDTISGNLDIEVMVPEGAQFMGALGCLLSRKRRSPVVVSKPHTGSS